MNCRQKVIGGVQKIERIISKVHQMQIWEGTICKLGYLRGLCIIENETQHTVVTVYKL